MGRNVTKSPDPATMTGQLIQIAHEGQTVDEILSNETWDFVQLKASPSKCTGCNLCVVGCVAAHDSGGYGTHLARLHIDPGNKPGQHKVMFCTSCQKCIDVCPTNALRWHPETGAVELLAELCDNCGECIEICPTKVIVHSDEGIQISAGAEMPAKTLEWYPVVCDLCGGEPECARLCPTGAIYTVERQTFNPQPDQEVSS
jgi:Fe-S-cluster-containing hydrogenase component 2